jgi:hypothetical protein
MDEEFPALLFLCELLGSEGGDPTTFTILRFLLELLRVNPPFAPTMVLTLVSMYAFSSSISFSMNAKLPLRLADEPYLLLPHLACGMFAVFYSSLT